MIGTEPVRSLGQLAKADETCTRCQLYRHATQVVPGEGPSHAAFMLVFEQPVTRKTSQGSRSLVPPVVFSIRRCGTRASGERKPSLPSRQFEILGHTRRNQL